MALAALIIAGDGEGSAGAAAPIFGMPLLEFQARQAASAGAAHIIIHAERVPATLVQGIDRLRDDGITAVLVRTAREAADAVHPDELVLIISGAVMIDMPFLKKQCATNDPVIVTRPLILNLAGQELIDADHAWAGVALLPGGLLRHTATMLGDWALAPTLLRLAVQASIKRLSLDDVRADSVRPATGVDLLAARADASVEDKVTAFVARKLAALPLRIGLLAAAPLMLMAFTVGFALLGWTITALFLFVLVSVLAEAVGRIATAALHPSRALSLYERVRPWVGRGLILAASLALMAAGSGLEAPVMALWCVWLFTTAPVRPLPWYAGETLSAVVLALGLFSPFPIAGIVIVLLHILAATIKTRFSGPSVE